MRKKIVSCFIVFLVCCLSLFGCGPRVDTSAENQLDALTLGRQIFGDLTITGYVYTYGENSGELKPVEYAIYSFLDELNTAVSTKETSSFLYKFNHRIGGKDMGGGKFRYEIDKHAYTMLSRAEALNKETDGYFDPTVYTLMKLWGMRTGEYNNDALHQSNGLPSLTEVHSIKDTFTGLDKFVLSQGDGKYYATKDQSHDFQPSNSTEWYTVMLDLGAQAKGYASDRIKDILTTFPQVAAASFSLSGNTYFYGRFPDAKLVGDKYYKQGDSDFISGVLDPSDANILGKPIFGFDVDGTGGVSAVTSGDYVRRYYYLDGQYFSGDFGATPPVASPAEVTAFCHIIDPKTGIPCNVKNFEYNTAGQKNKYENETVGKLTSVTILTSSSELADVYATAVMLMGMDEGIRFMKKKGLEGFLLGSDGVYASLLNDRKTYAEKDDGYTLTYSGYTPLTGYGI